MADETPAPKGNATRPWQGTTLGVLNIIGTVFLAIGAILFFFMRSVIEEFFSTGVLEVEGIEAVDAFAIEGMGNMLASMGVVFGIILLALAVLGIFMARGVFKGQKWSPILSIVLGVLSVIGVATSWDNSQILSLLIDLFIIYLAVMCVRNPFYNKG